MFSIALDLSENSCFLAQLTLLCSEVLLYRSTTKRCIDKTREHWQDWSKHLVSCVNTFHTSRTWFHPMSSKEGDCVTAYEAVKHWLCLCHLQTNIWKDDVAPVYLKLSKYCCARMWWYTRYLWTMAKVLNGKRTQPSCNGITETIYVPTKLRPEIYHWNYGRITETIYFLPRFPLDLE